MAFPACCESAKEWILEMQFMNIEPETVAMLELEHLYRSFRGIPAIEDVSFKVAPGEIVGFLGPNGAGKSTTVKIVTGMLRPNDGRVLFEGRDIAKDMVGFRAALGYVPEEAHLYSYLSGLEFLQLVGRLRGLDEALIEAKAARLLKLLNLESWQYSPISTYSKGMRQRVLISAALLHDPKLLIFDEPLSGLDVVTMRLFKDLLELLAAQGKAVLYISHVLEVVEQVCNRVIVIAKGRVLADAGPAELAKLMSLPNLESVFAQLVEQQDTRTLAQEMVEVMQIGHR
jgi:ABC-2 type transport system ATP-binding protein